MKINRIIKILYFCLIIIFVLSFKSYASDIRMQLFYGINNQAKNSTYLPFEVRLENRDEIAFNGYIIANVYESNDSIYKYKTNISIEPEHSISKNLNISVSPRNNTIIVELYDLEGEKQAEERVNIDISSLSNRLLIGILSSRPDELMYLDDLALDNGNVRTRCIEINDDLYENNRYILDQLDIIFISGIKSQNISEGLDDAIYNFINEGKVVFLGTGGEGDISIPSSFRQFVYGPMMLSRTLFNFNDYLGEDNNINMMTLPSTIYSMNNNSTICGSNDMAYVSKLNIGSGILCNAAFNFNDISDYSIQNNKFITKIIEEVLGRTRLNKISYNDELNNQNDFYNMKNMLDAIDYNDFPNILVYVAILSIYLFLVIIIVYAALRLYDKRDMYPHVVFVISIIFIILVTIVISASRRVGAYLTYFSIVEINDNNAKEDALIDYKAFDKKDYTFNTSNNNTVYPLMKNTSEPILLSDRDESDTSKQTSFEVENNVLYVDVKNEESFDESIFVYKNASIDPSIYNIDVVVRSFGDDITGRVTNMMNMPIKEASVVAYGKVIYIGDILANSSVTFSNAHIFNAPIGNNNMLSELMAYFPHTRLLNYYFDNNLNEYYEGYKFFGFVDNNLSLSLTSLDINNKSGETLIVKNVSNAYENTNEVDMSSFKYGIQNVSGLYNIENNSIDGNMDVVNDYYFSKDVKISKIYFENLTDFDLGRIDYNVTFYGNIYIYNNKTRQYELVIDKEISDKLDDYISDGNYIRCKFEPTNRDVLYRKICLPEVRAVGMK